MVFHWLVLHSVHLVVIWTHHQKMVMSSLYNIVYLMSILAMLECIPVGLWYNIVIETYWHHLLVVILELSMLSVSTLNSNANCCYSTNMRYYMKFFYTLFTNSLVLNAAVTVALYIFGVCRCGYVHFMFLFYCYKHF